jgi:hypothetical protein
MSFTPGDHLTSVPERDLARDVLGSYAGERQRFSDWLREDGSQPAGIQPADQLAMIAGFLDGKDDVSVEHAEEGSRGEDLEFRIGAGRVFHLREALRVILIDGLGLFFAFATTSGFGALLYAWCFISSADLINRFMKCFEKLDDPQERLVFETVYELQNQRASRADDSGADAPADEQYARLSPDANEIQALIADEMELSEVRDVLRGLAARDIVTERDGRWSVNFW